MGVPRNWCQQPGLVPTGEGAPSRYIRIPPRRSSKDISLGRHMSSVGHITTHRVIHIGAQSAPYTHSGPSAGAAVAVGGNQRRLAEPTLLSKKFAGAKLTK